MAIWEGITDDELYSVYKSKGNKYSIKEKQKAIEELHKRSKKKKRSLGLF
jgi:hypothetical protein